MAFERHWKEISSRLFTADGGADGSVVVNNTCGLRKTIAMHNPRVSQVWTQNIVDLTDFAGSTLNLIFQFHCIGSSSLGWYLDDILIEKTSSIMPNPEDFESG